MAMIVRDMIMLEKDTFEPSKASQFSDDSGWLGPPRAVPFSWEIAPGTPKQERSTEQSNSPQSSTAMVKFEPELQDCTALVKLESGRHSIHILDNAPRSFLLPHNATVETSGELSGIAVPFKWEMQPGTPRRDPDKCRKILDCPLTPPPVLHSRSMVVHSKSKHMSLSGRMRSLLWNSPSPRTKKKPDRLMSPKNNNGGFHVDEEDLSPVSVLEYNSSVRFHSRLSSASSSYQTPYHTPKASFSWDSSSSRASSSRGSLREPSRKRNSLSALMKQKKGCLMAMNSGNRSSSFNTSYSNEDSSVSLSDTSSTEHTQKSHNEDEASDGEGEDVYFSPLPYHLQEPARKESQFNRFSIVERVDSLETIDPGFAPSELDEDGYQGGIFNRMTSCARWQRRQSSARSKRSGSHLARSLFGRVVVCCYVPLEEDDHHRG